MNRLTSHVAVTLADVSILGIPQVRRAMLLHYSHYDKQVESPPEYIISPERDFYKKRLSIINKTCVRVKSVTPTRASNCQILITNRVRTCWYDS